MYFLCDGNCPVFWPSYILNFTGEKISLCHIFFYMTARNSIQHIAYTQIIHVFSNQQSPKECWILNWNVGSSIGSTPIPDRMVVYVCIVILCIHVRVIFTLTTEVVSVYQIEKGKRNTMCIFKFYISIWYCIGKESLEFQCQ